MERCDLGITSVTRSSINTFAEIIPCTVYRPKPAGENQPLVVYLHGGGLMFGSRLSYDSACKKISRLILKSVTLFIYFITHLQYILSRTA